MKIKQYLQETQYRSIFILITFLLNCFSLYVYKEEIIFLLGQHQPSKFPHFITTNLPEVFLCFIKLSISISFYLTFPIMLLQGWFFLIPALYKYEYIYAKYFLKLSFFFYFTLNCLTYHLLLPYCWKFFSGFQLDYEENGVSISIETRFYEYLTFFTDIFFSINIIFHLILALCFFITKFPIQYLLKTRKLFYFSSFTLATLITPPDIFSQILIGIILIILYELFMLSIFLSKHYKSKGE